MTENLGTDLTKIVTGLISFSFKYLNNYLDANEDKWNRTLFPQNNINSIKSLSKLCDDKLDEYLADAKVANIPQSATFDLTRHNDQLNSFSIVLLLELNSLKNS